MLCCSILHVYYSSSCGGGTADSDGSGSDVDSGSEEYDGSEEGIGSSGIADEAVSCSTEAEALVDAVDEVDFEAGRGARGAFLLRSLKTYIA